MVVCLLVIVLVKGRNGGDAADRVGEGEKWW